MNCMSRACIKLPCRSQALLTCSSSPCSSSCTKHEMRADMVSSDSTVIPSGWTHSNIFPDHYLIHASQLSMPRVIWRAQGLVAGGLEEAGAVDLIIYQVPIWMFTVVKILMHCFISLTHLSQEIKSSSSQSQSISLDF
jgi:hypothetical protein